VHLSREANPDVGGVRSTVHGEAHVAEGLPQDLGVLLVETHQPFHLRKALVLSRV